MSSVMSIHISSFASLMMLDIYVSPSSLVPATAAHRLPGACFLSNDLCDRRISHLLLFIRNPETLYHVFWANISSLVPNQIISSFLLTIRVNDFIFLIVVK
jgi:hypothetical protein